MAENYKREAPLYGHIHWHWALSELANENFDQVLEIYKNHLRPKISHSGPLGLIAVAASLVWRSKLKGYDLLDIEYREEINQYSRKIGTFNDVIFGEAHLALIFAHPELSHEKEALYSNLKKKQRINPCLKSELTLALVEAVNAFTNADYTTAIKKLTSVYPLIPILGGSNAQRELFEDTLIQSY